MKSYTALCLCTLVWAVPPGSQTGSVEYSSMFVHPETGDILGWDARMKPENEGYRLTLFCGEGSLQGPVHGTVRFVRNEASVVPDSEACGTPIRLRKLPNGLKIEVESGEWETVPKHKNFIADRMWK